MKWLEGMYKGRKREPLFLPTLNYVIGLGVLGMALGFQWYVWSGKEQNFFYIAAVTMLTTYIWGAVGLALWEMVQVLPLERRTFLRDLAGYTLGAGLLLWLQQVRFYFFGGFGSPRSDFSYFRNAAFFLQRESIFYLVIYAALILLLRGMYAQRRMQRVQLRTINLQEELVRVELMGLRSRLQPHFFFNALNTISALVHSDPTQADLAIELLSRLMRRTLEGSERESTSVAEELAAVEEYLQLQQMRFRSRLRYQLESSPDTTRLAVPVQLLQPIVENCVTHGVESSAVPTDVAIHCARDGDQLTILVTNTSHAQSNHQGFGRGLQSVERRMRLLYGDTARLIVRDMSGEYQVQLTLPITLEKNAIGVAPS
jgi:Putative regulator of cell autolysis